MWMLNGLIQINTIAHNIANLTANGTFCSPIALRSAEKWIIQSIRWLTTIFCRPFWKAYDIKIEIVGSSKLKMVFIFWYNSRTFIESPALLHIPWNLEYLQKYMVRFPKCFYLVWWYPTKEPIPCQIYHEAALHTQFPIALGHLEFGMKNKW